MTDRHQPHRCGAGTDWWIMNADGPGRHRLTECNDPAGPDHLGRIVSATVVSTDAWTGNRSHFYGDLELSPATSRSDILRLSPTCR